MSIPHQEPHVIKCSLPQSLFEIVTSSFYSKMEHEINQATEARALIHLCNINTHSTDQSQRLATLRLK